MHAKGGRTKGALPAGKRGDIKGITAVRPRGIDNTVEQLVFRHDQRGET